MLKVVLFLNQNPFAIDMFSGFVEQNREQVSAIFIFPFEKQKDSKWKQLWFFIQLYGFFGSFKKMLQLIGLKLKRKKYKNLKDLAEQHGIPSYEFLSPKEENVKQLLLELNPDVVYAALPHIVPKKLLDIPRLGFYNKHSSLLPYYKGVYPVFWQMLNGENKMGITIHKMEAGIDEGAILFQETYERNMAKTFDENYWFIIHQTSTVVNKSFQLLQTGNFELKKPQEEGSYYSFPKPADIKKFRKAGLKMI